MTKLHCSDTCEVTATVTECFMKFHECITMFHQCFMLFYKFYVLQCFKSVLQYFMSVLQCWTSVLLRFVSSLRCFTSVIWSFRSVSQCFMSVLMYKSFKMFFASFDNQQSPHWQAYYHQSPQQLAITPGRWSPIKLHPNWSLE